MEGMPYNLIENVLELILRALNIDTPYGKLDTLFMVAANLFIFRHKLSQILELFLAIIAFCMKASFELLPLFLVYYLTKEFYATEVEYYPITAGGGIMGGIIAFGLACIISFIVYRILHPDLGGDEGRGRRR